MLAGPPRSGDWHACAEHVTAVTGCPPHILAWLPAPGTAAWSTLPDEVKTWTLAWAGCMWVLHADEDLQARLDASHEISDALDWTAEARNRSRHAAAMASGAYIPRKVAAS
ncbi:DUF2742 domain-containing protein [Tsukamurella tyrosinosolvens]|uniref:DUF2742 domain-containing protein n=1 Tax=Tsukamurella tyrosinosolvens TaxID=57704 RepID=UPI000A49F541|nr:DUF2742 domain-containing protein [Tsukamurella tyrosinosolvens]